VSPEKPADHDYGLPSAVRAALAKYRVLHTSVCKLHFSIRLSSPSRAPSRPVTYTGLQTAPHYPDRAVVSRHGVTYARTAGKIKCFPSATANLEQNQRLRLAIGVLVSKRRRSFYELHKIRNHRGSVPRRSARMALPLAISMTMIPPCRKRIDRLHKPCCLYPPGSRAHCH